MKVAVVSTQGEQSSLNNVAKPNGWRYFYASQAEDLAEYRPDVLFLGGCFISEYSDWQLYRSLIGEIPKVIVQWMGVDVWQISRFFDVGERNVMEWLKSDRFAHIPPSDNSKKELSEWVGIESSEPLNIPAEKILTEVPKPSDFVVGSYLPPGRQKFFNIDMQQRSVPKTDAKVIFYHWLPPMEKVIYEGHHELRYALSREEYEKTIADCSCLLRIPVRDVNSISAAEFLMSGRPVISNNDLPLWPRMLNEEMDAEAVTAVIKKVAEDGHVPAHVQEFYRNQYDPAKYVARLVERCQYKWKGFSLAD